MVSDGIDGRGQIAEGRAIRINADLSIPEKELEFSFSSSSGPGGQHVNRSATKVTLRFDVASSPSLSDSERERILARLAARLDKDGMLQLQVQDSRSQLKNRAVAVERLQDLLSEALKTRKVRRESRPSRAAVEKRLAAKKQRAALKRERGRPADDEA